ncbi:MAG: endolytic transglycosylase MltG [Actinobacteria bacterium]|nr:endolytic transglycosylase MltG [Actinomycetota bacterium]
MSTGSKVFLVVLLLLFGAVGGGLWWVNDQLTGEPGEGEPVQAEISRGASASEVGRFLEERDVIKNATAFRYMARTRDLDRQLQAGPYEFRTGMSVDEAIDILLAGPDLPDEIRFTVQEGLTVDLVLARLDEAFEQYSAEDFRAVLDERLQAGANGDGLLRLPDWVPPLQDIRARSEDVVEPYEGLLFPQTYAVFDDATPLDVLQEMVDLLDETVAAIPEDQRQAAEELGLDRYEVLTLASLVERETRVDAERPQVAGVIHNRMEEGMLLQIDATVLYARGEHTERVLTSDTEIDNAYNTYVYEGLPPTPISNMGRASIEAAFAPQDVPHLYYVVKAPECDGTHAFAETLDEHNANVRRFRESDACGNR